MRNDKHLNEAIVRAAQKDWYSGSGEKRDYSVTQLLQEPKAFHLFNRHKHEIDEDVSEKLYMLMGSAMHAILERANEHDVEFTVLSRVRAFFEKVHNGEVSKNPGEIEAAFMSFIIGDGDVGAGQRLGYLLSLLPEERYLIEKRFKYVTKTGKVVAGGFDLYDTEEQSLHDYKFSSIYKWIYRNQPGNSTMEDWTLQLNMYRLFLENEGYPVKKLYINLLMRDYSKTNSKRERNYPDPIETIEIPLLGLDIVEQIIEQKVAEFDKYKMVMDDAIPVCSAKYRWQGHDTYAVMKRGNIKASKVEYSYAAAKSWMDAEAQKIAEKEIHKGKDPYASHQKALSLFSIIKRPAKSTRCESYCPVNKFCNFYKSLPRELK